ncbi:MAG: extracellular solute-binding protein [Bacilli bacterium]|nr:extracellular solute-binding protein [Bacilli bacterium]
MPVYLIKKTMLLTMSILLLVLSHLPLAAKAEPHKASTSFDVPIQSENSYVNILQNWLDLGYTEISSFTETYHHNQIDQKDNLIVEGANSHGFANDVISFTEDNIQLDFSVPQSGLYEIELATYSLTETIEPLIVSVYVNGALPYKEAGQLKLDSYWQDETTDFLLDRYGNEVLPKQIQHYRWTTKSLEDPTGLSELPLLFKFEAGANQLEIKRESGSFLLGTITIKSRDIIVGYADYLETHQDSNLYNDVLLFEAEQFAYKNTSQVRSGSVRDISSRPFSLVNLKINILDGNTFDEPGESVTYSVTVPETGYYHLTFKTKQSFYQNSPSYRTLLIDDEIPFEEMKHIPFPYSTRWENVTLASETGEAYKFFLEEGEHTLELKVSSSLYGDIYRSLQNMILEISSLTLDIKQLTGNNSDPNRDWDLEQYIPTISERLEAWRATLLDHIEELHLINGTMKNSRDIVFLDSAIQKFDKLLKDIDKLPYRLNILSEGSGSISQLVGDAMAIMAYQPLSIDSFYVHGDIDLPRSERSIFVKVWYGFRRFIASFGKSPYSETLEPDEVSIWVNRNRQIVDIMQVMADTDFFSETGIKVKFELMPDESKLILANAAGSAPDMAMGTHVNLAYNLALRGIAHDLREFEDFESVLSIYEQDGAIIPFIHDQGVYGLPETQNFNIMFYRKDILQSLGFEMPDDLPETWQDVLDLLPELQRFGMNFFIPLAYQNSYKTVDTTVPFLYQFDSLLYSENGMEAAIDRENGMQAIQFMSDLFTIYSLPMQVSSFYHQFRYGVLPIGIGDFGVYVQLTYAAPEIQNMWDIALIPGIERDDNTINRETTGPGHGMILLDSSDKKDEAWAFLKWWMETENQVDFEQRLTTTLGNEYMWNSANLEAFRLNSWNPEHKDIFLEQWQSLRNVPNSPATYMLERELSNIWNKIVMSGENPRDAVDESLVIINRELERKLNEFGYVDDFGEMIKPYPIATIAMIEELKNDD